MTGASGGIGRAIVGLFHEEGALVVATDLDFANVQALAAEYDGRVVAFELDVTNEDHWTTAIAFALERHGHLDVLINNAGIAIARDIETTSLVEWRRQLSVNLDGVFLGVKHAILTMKERGGGSIVNLSSVAGIVGAPLLAAYSSSKAGVRLLTKSAALHCAERGYGIRINSVHPSFTNTAMLDGFGDMRNKEITRKRLARRQPLGRLAEPEEVARAVLFLACEDSSFITGSELVVDGGLTAQ